MYSSQSRPSRSGASSSGPRSFIKTPRHKRTRSDGPSSPRRSEGGERSSSRSFGGDRRSEGGDRSSTRSYSRPSTGAPRRTEGGERSYSRPYSSSPRRTEGASRAPRSYGDAPHRREGGERSYSRPYSASPRKFEGGDRSSSRSSYSRPSTGAPRRTEGARSSSRPSYGASPSRDRARPYSSSGSRSFSDRSRGGSRGGSGFSGGNRPRGGGGGGRRMPTFNPSQFINTNPREIKTEEYASKHTFDMFGLRPAIVKTVTDLGITIPTPIQDQIIPEIMKGNDVIGLAETGTGKTAAFLLPLIEKTLNEDNRMTLILTPTRELALQIQDEMRKLSSGFRLFSTLCVGGTNIYPQIKGLQKKNHFVIGTPGRVLDLIKRGIFKTEYVTTVVLDEADRMLDMGFINDMRAILEGTPKTRETLFFSATMTREAERIVNDFLRNPVTVSVKKKDVTSSIEQDVVAYEHSAKFEKLTDLFADPELKRVIIFGAMKHSVEKLAQELCACGVKAESIHGNKTHGARQRSLSAFKSGNSRVLVATDVAARGIHVDGVTHVINYDLPNTFEDYVHRIGRTGRGDKRGKALTFVPKR